MNGIKIWHLRNFKVLKYHVMCTAKQDCGVNDLHLHSPAINGGVIADSKDKCIRKKLTHSIHKKKNCLLQKLQKHKKMNMSMSDYIKIFKNSYDELAAKGKPVNDHTKVFLLLNGLGTGYETFVTSMNYFSSGSA
ncbi:hypothetical protein EJ110_NYTH20191 [Nymphaea thermarum]|nr:hypothetical protein EJ110_NYTH20191 [Nymphaea thermarum]